MNTGGCPKAEGGAARWTPVWAAHAETPFAEPAPAEAPARLWQPLMTARLVLALALLLLSVLGWLSGQTPPWIAGLCALLVAITAASLTLPPALPEANAWSGRWLLTVWADLAVFALLEHLTPAGVNFTPLFVWPVLLAAVLGPRVLALGVASAATLLLLARAWQLEPVAGNAAWLQAAVTGTGLLLVALLASHLTARLAGETAAARRSHAQAQLQAEVNRLIAGALAEGIVVVDGHAGCPRYLNPAAARMLGVPQPQAASTEAVERVTATPAWRELLRWLAELQTSEPCTVRHGVLPHPDGRSQRVRVQIQTARGPDGLTAHLLVLQDLQALELRIHTEKLAAMGRVSAAIAHEIRNPLAAIAQACALLQEEASPASPGLLKVIDQNVRRINRTISDVLEAARAPQPHDTPATVLALDEAVDAVLADWLAQRPQGARLVRVREAGDAGIGFDAEHLRRVLVNLLDNADRHASAAAGAIRVESAACGARVRLTVWSDSAPLDPAMRQHLFEPFASSDSRSSGLGLYLSRELCRRYHAELTHGVAERQGRLGNAFTLDAPLAHPEACVDARMGAT
ncbi:Sensor protein ZraS [Tepidimonas alkaliphilus]|uniref:histidine kinase n=1 Tax=Tepidimonas alkaliphilus TaxID=2588942 RepID=A0A554W5N1_9BURK|nr:ATP-binding protein [Tepidimonas alkaliphilus]TSE18886.1 Sensor protein ZraS [Tepidimonas alkaliphilus]